MRQSLLVFGLFSFFLLFSLSFAKAQEYYISNCSVLDQENATYYLTQDIIDSTNSTCIDIQANNIVLDCQGHTIDGIDASDTYGIHISYSNISVKNCIITDWNNGIYLESNNNFLSNIMLNSNYRGILSLNSNYNNLTDIIISHSDTEGIYFQNSNNNNLTNIVVEYSEYYPALNMYSSNNNIIENVTLRFNGMGVQLVGSNYNTFKNSKIIENNYYGFYISGSTGNQIYNNLFNNSNNFNFGGDIYPNYWNTSYQEGENIWNASLGYIGGNFWTNPNGNGYSDTCLDRDYNGFCDDPYVLATDNIDYLPIAKTVGKYCVEPYEGMVIDRDTTFCRGTYYLNFTTPESKIRFSNPNVKVYCNETIFIGNNTPDSIAIFIDRDNVTITKTDDASFGCKFSNYRRGIVAQSQNPVIEYVEIENIQENGEAGVFVENANNFTVRHIRGYNSTETVDIRGYNNYGTVYDIFCHNMTSWGCVVTGFNPPQNLTLNIGDIRCEGAHCLVVTWAEDLRVNCFGTIDFPPPQESPELNLFHNIMVFESSKVEIENCTVANSKIMGIRIHNSNYVTLKNSKAHNTQIGVLIDGGSNNILENVETWNNNDKGMEVNSENTILRSIYNHDEPRSTISGNNNTLEYSRCENVEYGCWHIFADNSTIRHNNFFRLGFFGVNGGEVYNNTIGEFNIRDWEKPSSFIKIYNNTIYSYLHNYFNNYRSDSIEIYDNYFYGMHGVLDRGGTNTSVHNNFFNVSQFSIGFYNGATDSHAFSNEIHGTNAFFFGGTKNAVINDNIIEADTLAYYRGYWGNAENIISCNNTILAFNKSWDYDPNYNISLLNVMRIESDSCEPYVSIVSMEPVGFGSVKIGKESNATVPITIKSNMVNVSILVRGDSDFPDFPISSVRFLADKDKPYPVEEVQLEKDVIKAVSVFLPSLTSTLHSLWRISVPSGIAAGSKQARATIFASIPQASDSRQLVLSLDAVSEVVPPPRLYQLSPIAGMLAYILLPMVFALVAQKYLLGEVEFTVQGLIKYLLLFIMVIIIAIGFALVFSII